MISEKTSTMLNDQVNEELFSSYLYLDFANFFVEKGLDGFANWFNMQAKEELEHALKIVKYMHDNDLKVIYSEIGKPNVELKDPLQIVKEALKHEMHITECIEKIYQNAESEKDYRTQDFLDWFIKEQAEEETSAREIVTKVEMFGGAIQGLYILDKEFSQRQ